MHENREVPAVSGAVPHPDWSGKVCGRNPDMYAAGKSYTGVVPMKEPNEAEGSAEEEPEGRPVTEGKTVEAPATRTQGRGEALSGLGRIRTGGRGIGLGVLGGGNRGRFRRRGPHLRLCV